MAIYRNVPFPLIGSLIRTIGDRTVTFLHKSSWTPVHPVLAYWPLPAAPGRTLSPFIVNGMCNSFGSGASGNIAQWNLNSSDNLIGFRFFNEDNSQVHYGWFRVAFGATVTQRTLVEYAYESTAGGSIMAGMIPGPGALALLGLAGLTGARRRRA